MPQVHQAEIGIDPLSPDIFPNDTHEIMEYVTPRTELESICQQTFGVSLRIPSEDAPSRVLGLLRGEELAVALDGFLRTKGITPPCFPIFFILSVARIVFFWYKGYRFLRKPYAFHLDYSLGQQTMCVVSKASRIW